MNPYLDAVLALLGLGPGHLNASVLEAALKRSALALDDHMTGLDIHRDALRDDNLLASTDLPHH